MIQTVEEQCSICGLPQLKIIRKGVSPQICCIDPKCESNTSRNNLGKCPTCETGEIRILYSKAGKRFAGCSGWPNCNQTYPLRPKGTVTATGESCPVCKAPIIAIGNYRECINPECESRKRKAD